jgi:L-aspartate oxidase
MPQQIERGAAPRGPAAPLACDVVIVGGGVAGLTVALSLPPALSVVLVTKAALGESNTRYAQGGLAVAIGADDDPALHLRDTLAAGAGLVDEVAARTLVEEGPDAFAWLVTAGAHFDERERPAGDLEAGSSPAAPPAARYALGHEAAHSRRRVLHARGDATGAEIERALVAAVRARPRATILEHADVRSLLVEDGACRGVALWRAGARREVRARRGTVLANGGAGQLWLRTSNPTGATADGLALAWRAGAVLADLEFMQFHPTVLLPPTPGGEAFLVSEAVRGEGAYLRNATGERFMPRYHPDAELAPRDVVARAILDEMLASGAPSAFLDLRHLDAAAMRARFPTIAAACARYGLDLARDPIPVAPAAHYFMGGVATDRWARTTLPGLYAVGEVACTGVHGANRLASNSLLEGLVFGRRAARCLADANAERPGLDWPAAAAPLPGEPVPAEVVAPAVRAGDISGPTRWALRRIMWEHVSLRRGAAGLRAAAAALRVLAEDRPVDPETGNMLVAAQLIVAAALARRESRGAHSRSDHPALDPARDGRHSLLRPGPAPAPRVAQRAGRGSEAGPRERSEERAQSGPGAKPGPRERGEERAPSARSGPPPKADRHA